MPPHFNSRALNRLPSVIVDLKNFHAHIIPDDYPFPLDPNRPTMVLFFEWRGREAPPGDIGYPCDSNIPWRRVPGPNPCLTRRLLTGRVRNRSRLLNNSQYFGPSPNRSMWRVRLACSVRWQLITDQQASYLLYLL
jgi:hypothetical protein